MRNSLNPFLANSYKQLETEMNQSQVIQKSDQPIDIVLCWVDGDAPEMKVKREAFLSGSVEKRQESIGGDTRYRNIGEIKYCIASINIFASFIRKIFIITDRQQPDIAPYLEDLSINNPIPVEIVDHSVIFNGYEEYLPTFNSRSLETLLWRIPDLSEKFILMNDDFAFIDRVSPEDFFIGSKSICYGDWYPTLWAELLRALKPKKKGIKQVGFKDSMLNALKIMGGGCRFICLSHTPRALKKSFYEDFFAKNNELVIRNIRDKFRTAEQFNSQELFYLHEYKEGRCIVRPAREYAHYLKPRRRKDYIENKIKKFSKEKRLFLCMNSLDLASVEDQKKMLGWLDKHLRQNLFKSL